MNPKWSNSQRFSRGLSSQCSDGWESGGASQETENARSSTAQESGIPYFWALPPSDGDWRREGLFGHSFLSNDKCIFADSDCVTQCRAPHQKMFQMCNFNFRSPYWYRHSYHQPHAIQFFAPQDFDYVQQIQAKSVRTGQNNNTNKGGSGYKW